jgi:putative zinc ribbon protein
VKSNKQRRGEIQSRRQKQAAKQAALVRQDPRSLPSSAGAEEVPCNPALLAAYNSYGVPAFVARGHYVDTPFECISCGRQEVWRATQQKWWYEVAKGNVESRANRCNPCRRAARERSAQARKVHLQGVAAKRVTKSAA